MDIPFAEENGFRLCYKPADPTNDPETDEPIKIVYIWKREAPTIDIKQVVLKLPITEPYSDTMCNLRILSDICWPALPGNAGAYPGFLSAEELATLFPNCVCLDIEYKISLELSELCSFTALEHLRLETPLVDLRGIEFLDSLKSLCIASDQDRIDLSPLSAMSLSHLICYLGSVRELSFTDPGGSLELLHLECSKLTSLIILQANNLKGLTLSCPCLRTLEGSDLRGVATVGIIETSIEALATTELADNCVVNLLGPPGFIHQHINRQILERARVMFPKYKVRDPDY